MQFVTVLLECESTMLSEISPMDKEKKTHDFTYMWNIKQNKKDKWINKTKQNQNHIYRQQNSCYQRKRGWENELGKGVQIYGNRGKLESGENAIEHTDNEL